MNFNICSSIQNINLNDWNKFVEEHPNGNFFQSAYAHELFSKTKLYEPLFVTCLNPNKEIIGIIQGVLQKEYSGLIGFLTSRIIITGGPIVKNNDKNVLDILLKEWNLLVKHKALYTQIRNLFEQNNQLKDIYTANKFKFENHSNILIKTNTDFEDISSEFHKSRKRNHTKACNKGVKFKLLSGNDIEQAYQLLKETYHRVNLPFPHQSLFSLCFSDHFSNKVIAFGALYEGRLIGVRFLISYKNTLYDWYAGSSDSHKNKYPNDFLIYNILNWASENKFEYFDFGGAGKLSNDYGVRDHKLKFGGKLVSFGRFTKVHFPSLFYLIKNIFLIWKKLKK